MPAERHFRFRREVAHPPAAALPRRESRLGKADLGGDPPHLLGFRQRAADRHAGGVAAGCAIREGRSEEHTSELQSLMRISYAVFCLKNKRTKKTTATEVYRTSNTE